MLHLVRLRSARLLQTALADISTPCCSYSDNASPSINPVVSDPESHMETLQSVKASRVADNDPNKFTVNNIGQWYTVEEGQREKIFYHPLLPLSYANQIDTFLECSFMVRKPLVDLVHCLKLMNSANPVNRYVIYGKNGHGKTLTLLQMAHYAHSNKWIVCYVANATNWARRIKEIAMSTSRPGRIDLPLNAADWLSRFKLLNEDLIKEFDLKTTRKYEWSEWELTDEGRSLLEVVDMGLNRMKFATDCVAVLLRELKLAASDRKCKLLIAVDAANAMFVDTLIKREDRTMAPASDMSLFHAFRKSFKPVWNNGAVVVTVDQKVDKLRMLPSHLPNALLRPEGFDHFDPFVPIPVEKYNEKEWNSALDYYIDRNWLHCPQLMTETGRMEMAYMSGFNPEQLERLAAAAP